MTRRDSLLALGTLATTMPFTLHAQEYKGALIIETDHEESRFKIGKDAFLLRPNSKIALEHDGVFTKALSLLGGGAMAVFGGGEKKVHTKTFTAGIRGTGIYLQEYADDMVYSCLCYGKADYHAPLSSELLLSLEAIHHDKPIQVVKTSKGKLEYYEYHEPNHSDDELRRLEKMCGREVPFEAYLKEKSVKTPYKR